MASTDEELIVASIIIKSRSIYNKDMILLHSRIKSFDGANLNIKQTPEQLAEAGFYYMGSEDKCVCYYCGLGVYKWQPEDDPWFEHALLSDICEFLNLKKSDLKFQLEKVLHLVLNLLAIARDTPTLQDHLGYFVSECQSLVEDHNNFKIKKGVYANKPDLPQQYCPKSFLFSKWGEVSKYQPNVSPPDSRDERVIKHKFIAARLLVIGDITGYREHRGCPSTICTEDVAGRVCDVCYHMPEAHSAWEEPERMPQA
ncbi:Death-associated inhibitor of apoptosis 1 [Folsomia candida]|uniref:Death-associated inhibitor of apoptosis 1 n=1 Tax=Folsomia candida TaxID=158441 RepID=A0A226DMX9_FOLCA|nr:Death-associated inhibitor of apoptosis 1 [Folsomia candida]